MKAPVLLLFALALCAASGCATRDADPTLGAAYEAARPAPGAHVAAADNPAKAAPDTPADDEVLDDSAFDDAAASEKTIADPFQPWNRMWFTFNDFMYMNVIKPVYRGYEFVTPEALRSGLSNALRNLQAPLRIVNSILQFEFAQAVVEFGRFIFNTTFGGLGLVEIVRVEDALVPIDLGSATFGGTLAKWGFGDGPYLVWPILGPSTLRDTFGMAGDIGASIPFWASRPRGPLNEWIGYGVSGGLRFNSFGRMLDGYEALTKSAIEPYTAVRDAYVKLHRQAGHRDTSLRLDTVPPLPFPQ